MPEMLDELVRIEEESYQKILSDMLSEEHIKTKTEIRKPLAMTRLEMSGVWLESEGMTESAKFIELFAEKFRINMISNNRQSRKEIIQALTEGLKQERTMGEKLTSPPEKGRNE